jgi:hypothetical protein
MNGLPAVLMGLVFLATPSEPAADLMKRLAEQDARLEKVDKEGSYIVTDVSEELAADWSVKHTRKMVTRVSLRNGKQERTLQKAEKDGEDRTEEVRKKLKEKDKDDESEVSSPFGAGAQARYQFIVVGPDDSNPSFLRIKFEPKGKKSESLTIGEAVVDPAAGEVVRLVQRPSENPSHVDRLQFVLQFDEQTPSGRLLSKVSFDGEGGILLFKKRFRGTMTYSNYELAPRDADRVATPVAVGEEREFVARVLEAGPIGSGACVQRSYRVEVIRVDRGPPLPAGPTWVHFERCGEDRTQAAAADLKLGARYRLVVRDGASKNFGNAPVIMRAAPDTADAGT